MKTTQSGSRLNCGSCGSDKLGTLLSLGMTPVANTFLADPDASVLARRYPLSMLGCRSCGLMQVGYVIPDEILWSDDFGYYSSMNAPLLRHFAEYAQWAMCELDPDPDLPVIEVGCNDGVLLRHFAEAGYATLGVDPAPGPAAAARERGLSVIGEGLTRELAHQIQAKYGNAGLVLANNVAAHVSDLADFLSACKHLLSPFGRLVLEVQDFEQLLMRHGFDMLYHEHRFFYSLPTLERTLQRHGFQVLQARKVPTQGGSWRVVATHSATIGQSVTAPIHSSLEFGIQRRADLIAKQLRDTLAELASGGKKIALYGAPAKATTLLHWTGVAGFIDHAVDTTPAKIGRFMPGTRIPIVSEEDRRPADVYLLAAWNYASSILRKESAFLSSGGQFVLPLPVPMVI